MIDDPERVAVLCRAVNADLETVSKLESQATTPDYRDSLKLVRSHLEDIETLYVADLTRENLTKEKEAAWLTYAERAVALTRLALRSFQPK
jgi:hypothetical protein